MVPQTDGVSKRHQDKMYYYFCRAFFVLRSFRFLPIKEPTCFPAFGDNGSSRSPFDGFADDFGGSETRRFFFGRPSASSSASSVLMVGRDLRCCTFLSAPGACSLRGTVSDGFMKRNRNRSQPQLPSAPSPPSLPSSSPSPSPQARSSLRAAAQPGCSRSRTPQ